MLENLIEAENFEPEKHCGPPSKVGAFGGQVVKRILSKY